MKVRIVSAGWENYTGTLGQGAHFEEGIADLTPRQIMRIGSSVSLECVESGEQVGPSSAHLLLQPVSMPVQEQLVTQVQEDAEFAFNAQKLAEEEEARKAAEAEALEAAKAKAAADAASVVYTRTELEAIAANDGIDGLRAIATPLGVKGRAINELVSEILSAQARAVSA